MSFVYAKIRQKLCITRQIYEKYCDLADYGMFFARNLTVPRNLQIVVEKGFLFSHFCNEIIEIGTSARNS